MQKSCKKGGGIENDKDDPLCSHICNHTFDHHGNHSCYGLRISKNFGGLICRTK